MNIVLEGKKIGKVYVREGFLGAELGKVEALKGVNFTVSKGEILGIVGESGSGKSTLAKIICGLIKPTSGSLIWKIPLNKGKFRPVQMVFQNPFNSLNPKLTIGYMLKEAIAYGRKDRVYRIKHKAVKEILDKVGMGEVNLLSYPHQFSGGQRQRLGIARALAMNPDILVCDEPVSALDISIQAQIINLLIDINSKTALPIIFIAHDIEVVSLISHNIMVMKEGEVVEYGEVQKVIHSPENGYTKLLMDAVPHNPWLAEGITGR